MLAVFSRTPNNLLAPADEGADKFIRQLKFNEGAMFDVKKLRNLRFHRKAFALLRLSYDMWTPRATGHVVMGMKLVKDFDSFRKDILILAGHADPVYSVDGKVRFEPRSMSFARCDEFEFSDLYRRILDVVWRHVLHESGFEDQGDVDRVVEALLRFE